MIMAIQTCPMCFSADEVSMQRLPDGLVRYTCADARRHDGHEHVWELTARQAAGTAGTAAEGVTDELLDPLLHCIAVDEPFLEYGIVEHRLSKIRPDLYAAHIRERGHVMLEPSSVTATNSRFVPALVRLRTEGQLIKITGPATGAWSYNGQISYWARPGAAESNILTWEDFCLTESRESMWTAVDRAAARGEVA
jgi:hypothetical protein